MEETKNQAKRDLEEQKSIIQHDINSDVNKKISKFDEIKSNETFKYKSSGTSIKRICEIRSKIREAITEGERDFEDFSTSNTSKILNEALDALDNQEGLIRLAETNKFGYKLVAKLEASSTAGYTLIKDAETIKKIKNAEKELEKSAERENETSKRRYRRRQERSRSRSRSRSRAPRQKKSSSARNYNRDFTCHWCGRPGHS